VVGIRRRWNKGKGKGKEKRVKEIDLFSRVQNGHNLGAIVNFPLVLGEANSSNGIP
jgi:hypothetical protein